MKNNFRLQSSADGLIKHLVLAFDRGEKSLALPKLKKLVENMPSRVHFTFLHRNGKPDLEVIKDTICNDLRKAPHRFRFIAANPPHTWIRDDFLVAEAKDGKRILLSHDNASGYDYTADYIARNVEGYRHIYGSLELPGGNVMVMDKHVLVGKSSVPGKTDPTLKKTFQKEYDGQRTPVFVGDELNGASADPYLPLAAAPSNALFPPVGPSQFLFHLDCYMAYAGIIDGKPHLIVGRPVNPFDPNHAVTRHHQQRIEREIEQIREGTEGKVVIKRIDLPLLIEDKITSYAPYANCLVENTSQERRVWLPYLAPPDPVQPQRWEHYYDKIADCWKGLGFETIRMDNFFDIVAEKDGALRCMTHEIARSPH